jgi:translation initiation factor IF-1
MKVDRIENFLNGWFVGSFTPTTYDTTKFEVAYKKHKKDEIYDCHYHKVGTEINLLIRGKMSIQDVELNDGDIFILQPYEISNPVFFSDCEVLVIRNISGIKDKFIVN